MSALWSSLSSPFTQPCTVTYGINGKIAGSPISWMPSGLPIVRAVLPLFDSVCSRAAVSVLPCAMAPAVCVPASVLQAASHVCALASARLTLLRVRGRFLFQVPVVSLGQRSAHVELLPDQCLLNGVLVRACIRALLCANAALFRRRLSLLCLFARRMLARADATR